MESDFKEALDSNFIPVNGGSIGNVWNREKNKDKALKAAYGEIKTNPANKGNIPKLQAAFRMEWGRKKYESARSERTKEVIQKDTVVTRGEYLTAAQIWDREAQGSTGLIAMKNYVMMAITV